MLDFVLKALYLTGISKYCFVLKAVAFVIADVCSHRQLKGNFAGSGCLMDLCKQTKWELAGSKEAFGLQKDAQKSNAIGGWGGGRKKGSSPSSAYHDIEIQGQLN